MDHTNPQHYRARGRFECIEVIEDWNLGYHLGNVLKYIYRAGLKNPETEIQDLEKAIWYLTRYKDRVKSLKKPSNNLELFAARENMSA